jgi:hypothetical protein
MGLEASGVIVGRLIQCQIRLANAIGASAQNTPRQPTIPPK